MILLSILIPTLPESKFYMNRIMCMLKPQLNDQVEIVIDDRLRNIPTGTKRNDLIARANGEYVVSVDCDDHVSSQYVSKILQAINKSHPDCVTFEGWYTENGRNRVDWVIKLGEKYEARTENGKYMFFRFPNHLAVIKKELAKKVKFPAIWKGEDYAWALEMKSRRILQTSEHIPELLYHYDFLTNK
jgi:ribosomal protein S24E